MLVASMTMLKQELLPIQVLKELALVQLLLLEQEPEQVQEQEPEQVQEQVQEPEQVQEQVLNRN